jgi:hypothetical protein
VDFMTRAPTLRALLLLAALPAAACSPSLATMQPAHVAPKGHFQATGALEVGVPTGTIVRTIDAGRTLAEAGAQQMSLTADEQRQVFEAGVNFVAVPPAVGPQLAIAYTPVDRLEVGIRNAGGGWRLGVRYQLLSHETDAADLTVGVGVSRSTYQIPLADYIPILEIDDFTRYTIDTPVLVGTSRSWYRVWAGPRFLYSRFSTAMRLAIPGAEAELASFEGHTTYLGGQAGFALGYKHLFFGFELTLVQGFGSASVKAATLAEVRPVDYSGFVVYPAFGFLGEF